MNIKIIKQYLLYFGLHILHIKVAYNSGMFDNSHLLIMQYFFSNDLWKISERLVNTKEEMTKFEWSCAANFEVIRYLV